VKKILFKRAFGKNQDPSRVGELQIKISKKSTLGRKGDVIGVRKQSQVLREKGLPGEENKKLE